MGFLKYQKSLGFPQQVDFIDNEKILQIKGDILAFYLSLTGLAVSLALDIVSGHLKKQ